MLSAILSFFCDLWKYFSRLMTYVDCTVPFIWIQNMLKMFPALLIPLCQYNLARIDDVRIYGITRKHFFNTFSLFVFFSIRLSRKSNNASCKLRINFANSSIQCQSSYRLHYKFQLFHSTKSDMNSGRKSNGRISTLNSWENGEPTQNEVQFFETKNLFRNIRKTVPRKLRKLWRRVATIFWYVNYEAVWNEH